MRIEAVPRVLRILLAEDDHVNQVLATRLLERDGHAVDLAANGREAVERSRDGYDVILMDVQMPVLSGLEATARIRAREAEGGPRTPIVALTANAMDGDRERCLAAGMDGYVPKPLDPALLRQAIADALLAEAPWRGAAGPAATASVPSAHDEAAPFDRARALQRLGGDSVLLIELSALFLAESPGLFEAVTSALDRADAAALERAAHTVKSAAGTLAAGGVAAAASVLEAIGRGGDLGDAPAAVAALLAEVTRLEVVLAGVVGEERPLP